MNFPQVSLVFLISIALPNFALADWKKVKFVDDFTDKIYYQWRSSTVSSNNLSLGCKQDNVQLYLNNKGTVQSDFINLRVDKYKALRGFTFHIGKESHVISMNNEEERFFSEAQTGSYLLLAHHGLSPIRIGLKNFKQAYKETLKSCQESSDVRLDGLVFTGEYKETMAEKEARLKRIKEEKEELEKAELLSKRKKQEEVAKQEALLEKLALEKAAVAEVKRQQEIEASNLAKKKKVIQNNKDQKELENYLSNNSIDFCHAPRGIIGNVGVSTEQRSQYDKAHGQHFSNVYERVWESEGCDGDYYHTPEKVFSDHVFSLGVGTDGSLNVELSSVRPGFGYFIGYTFSNSKDEKIGPKGIPQYTWTPESHVVSDGTEYGNSLNAGINYNIGSKYLKHSFGLGVERTSLTKYSNWSSPDQIAHYPEQYYIVDSEKVELTSLVSYKLILGELVLGTSYRNLNKEVMFSLGFRL